MLEEATELIRKPETPPSVKVQLLQSMDRLLSLMPGGGKLPAPPEQLAEERGELEAERERMREAIRRLTSGEDGRLAQLEEATAPLREQVRALESQGALLRTALHRLDPRPTEQVLAELSLAGRCSQAAPPAVASAPAPAPEPLERARAALERGERPSEDALLSLTSSELAALEREFTVKLQRRDGDPGWPQRSPMERVW